MRHREADEYMLNAAVLRDRISRAGLKQWWIAEKLGVHRKTVSRWVNGAVGRTSRGLAEGLAELLGVEVEEITVAGVVNRLSSVADTIAAAEVLSRPDVLDRLGPPGNWQSVEHLLKSTLVSGLSPSLRGKILNNLSIVSWRQGKVDLAEEYAAGARDIGNRTSEKSILIPAVLNLANISSWRGDVRTALRLYRMAIDDDSVLDPRRRAGALSNYGAVLSEAGELEKARTSLFGAIELYEAHGRPMNLSIAHAQLALVLLEQGETGAAGEHIRASSRHAAGDEYHRGLQFALLLEAELCAAQGDGSAARLLVERGLGGFADLCIHEGKNYEIAARALRLADDPAAACHLVAKGLPLCAGFPMEAAALHVEHGLALRGLSDADGARRAHARARQLFSACGAGRRVAELDALGESYAVAWRRGNSGESSSPK